MDGKLRKSRVARLIRTWCLLKPHFIVIEIQVVGTTPDPIMYVSNSCLFGRYVRNKTTSIYACPPPWRFAHSTSALLKSKLLNMCSVEPQEMGLPDWSASQALFQVRCGA